MFLDEFKEIRRLAEILQVSSILDAVQLEMLDRPEHLMELGEYACIFERLTRPNSDPILVMKDGLLRTKIFKLAYKRRLWEILREHPTQRLVGVAKWSQVLNILGTALKLKKKIPSDRTGYIAIPPEIEQQAYQQPANYRFYPFGRLYLAKLSSRSDLLVTLEIPYDVETQRPIYPPQDIEEIIGHLIKDAKASFPSIGYPQTIMRAHEKAVQVGIPASIWKDKIIDEILVQSPEIRKMLLEANTLREYVSKQQLGGL